MNRKTIFALILIGTVAACDRPVSTPKPPGDKMSCAGEPGRPVGSGPVYTDSNGVERHEVTDEENGEYLRSLRGAGQDCRDKVNWFRDYFSRLP